MPHPGSDMPDWIYGGDVLGLFLSGVSFGRKFEMTNPEDRFLPYLPEGWRISVMGERVRTSDWRVTIYKYPHHNITSYADTPKEAILYAIAQIGDR